MERKLFNRIGLLVSIGLIVLFVVCSFSFFEHDIILNNNPIALFHEQFLWFMPTLLMLITFIVPISTKRVNILILGALINTIIYFFVVGTYDATLKRSGINVHHPVAIIGYVLLALLLASAIVDSVMKILYENKLPKNWNFFSNIVVGGVVLLSIILIMIGWLIRLSGYGLTAFGILASLGLCLFIGFNCYIFVNLKFDYIDFLNMFKKEEQKDVEELKQAAAVESSHSNRDNVVVAAELNPELNEARQEYLKMMAEGLEELNKQKSSTSSTEPKKSQTKKSSSKKVKVNLEEKEPNSTTTKKTRKSTKKESE
ncbi:MAG: hypothetical protein ACI311_06335 [Bacilli bacterium]